MFYDKKGLIKLFAGDFMTKKEIRQLIFDKYNGKCAYCGIELKAMDIDHIKPKAYGGTDELTNLNPACKHCNNYKCNWDLESFREYLKQMINEKPEYLFKSLTKMQIAVNIGSVEVRKWDGVFYFER